MRRARFLRGIVAGATALAAGPKLLPTSQGLILHRTSVVAPVQQTGMYFYRITYVNVNGDEIWQHNGSGPMMIFENLDPS